MIIKNIDAFESWEQIKAAAHEARKFCLDMKRKYKLWNEPMAEVTVFYERNGRSECGYIHLDCINLKTGETHLTYYVDQEIQYKRINLREHFKK